MTIQAAAAAAAAAAVIPISIAFLYITLCGIAAATIDFVTAVFNDTSHYGIEFIYVTVRWHERFLSVALICRCRK